MKGRDPGMPAPVAGNTRNSAILLSDELSEPARTARQQVRIQSPDHPLTFISRLVGATISVISQLASFRRSLGIGTNPLASGVRLSSSCEYREESLSRRGPPMGSESGRN
jgi:hypothetical protein